MMEKDGRPRAQTDLAKVTSKKLARTRGTSKSILVETPTISLPKGGGAIKSIDEKFTVNASNWTATVSIPLPFSPSRSWFVPSRA